MSESDMDDLRAQRGPDYAVRRHFIDTRIPMQRPGTAEDMADAAMFLANCSYATGMVLDVDGGWTAL